MNDYLEFLYDERADLMDRYVEATTKQEQDFLDEQLNNIRAVISAIESEQQQND